MIHRKVLQIFVKQAKEHNMSKKMQKIKNLESVTHDNDGFVSPDLKKGSVVKIAKNASYTKYLPTDEGGAMDRYIKVRDQIKEDSLTWVNSNTLRLDGMSPKDIQNCVSEGLIRAKNNFYALEDYNLLIEHLEWVSELVHKGIFSIAESKKETWLIADFNKKGNSKIKNKLIVLDSIVNKYQSAQNGPTK
jgi:hypothetical protein